jgi:hypothetical protein
MVKNSLPELTEEHLINLVRKYEQEAVFYEVTENISSADLAYKRCKGLMKILDEYRKSGSEAA